MAHTTYVKLCICGAYVSRELSERMITKMFRAYLSIELRDGFFSFVPFKFIDFCFLQTTCISFYIQEKEDNCNLRQKLKVSVSQIYEDCEDMNLTSYLNA